jgi:hypothetical protein
LVESVSAYLLSLTALPSSTDLRLPMLVLAHITSNEDVITHMEVLSVSENEHQKLKVSQDVASVRKVGEI